MSRIGDLRQIKEQRDRDLRSALHDATPSRRLETEVPDQDPNYGTDEERQIIQEQPQQPEVIYIQQYQQVPSQEEVAVRRVQPTAAPENGMSFSRAVIGDRHFGRKKGKLESPMDALNRALW